MSSDPFAPQLPLRRVLAGRPDGESFLITLDGDELVEVADYDIARVASRALKEGREIEALIERPAGKRPQLVEARLADAKPQTPPPASAAAAPASRPASSPQALVRAPEVPEGLIQTPHELTRQLEHFRAHYNVLSPAIQISQLAPGYGANLSVVPIDASVDDKGFGSDTYCNAKIMKGDERALSKIGLTRIAQAAGIQWIFDHCRRVDDGRILNLWRWQYAGVYRTHDGSLQQVLGSAEADLRDGSAEIQGWSDAQVKQQRSKGNEICETKAMLRAIRNGLAIRQKYSVADLKKPFVVVRFTFTPDMNDPEIKRMVTEQALKGIGALYAPPVTAMLPPKAHPDDVDEAAPAPATTAAVATKSNPFAEADASTVPPDATFVVNVEPRTGKNKEGRPWTLYKVTFENGQVASTFSETLHQLIDEAKKLKAPVRIKTVENAGYDDKLEALSIVDQRQPMLPGAAENGGKY